MLVDCVFFLEKDLQKFVNVALHTSAGEGDYSSDRLSNLKIVGSGYGPLIYKLEKASNFEVFISLCEDVWNSLDQTPKLPTLLVSYFNFLLVIFRDMMLGTSLCIYMFMD